MKTTLAHLAFSLTARPAVQMLRSSAIREVANVGMGRPDVLPFWFGEPDEATAESVRRVAVERILDGDTFYVQTLGLPILRERIAAYASELHRPRSSQSIAVTSSGTSALMLAMQALVSAGDRAVAVTPLWPNLVEMPRLLGGRVTTVPLTFETDGWRLDLDALLDALTPVTRVLLINSPNNPTGWVMPLEQQRLVLAHCRRHGIWIVSDDVYERYYFSGACAPSFLDISEPDDRVVSCNSFSKAWLMTGWRIGWMSVPEEMLPDISKLIEYNTTCTPGFVQHAACRALEDGEAGIRRTVTRLRHARDHLAGRLAGLSGVELAAPAAGAMYTFFRIDGVGDSLSFCKQLVFDHGLGLAPGIAFGQEGEGYLRWCYASSIERLDAGVERLSQCLARRVLR